MDRGLHLFNKKFYKKLPICFGKESESWYSVAQKSIPNKESLTAKSSVLASLKRIFQTLAEVM